MKYKHVLPVSTAGRMTRFSKTIIPPVDGNECTDADA